jgi:hypothetical protein
MKMKLEQLEAELRSGCASQFVLTTAVSLALTSVLLVVWLRAVKETRVKKPRIMDRTGDRMGFIIVGNKGVGNVVGF